nr:MAG TPA: hypothetical protein [Bacteriophage sp.]
MAKKVINHFITCVSLVNHLSFCFYNQILKVKNNR